MTAVTPALPQTITASVDDLDGNRHDDAVLTVRHITPTDVWVHSLLLPPPRRWLRRHHGRQALHAPCPLVPTGVYSGLTPSNPPLRSHGPPMRCAVAMNHVPKGRDR